MVAEALFAVEDRAAWICTGTVLVRQGWTGPDWTGFDRAGDETIGREKRLIALLSH